MSRFEEVGRLQVVPPYVSPSRSRGARSFSFGTAYDGSASLSESSISMQPGSLAPGTRTRQVVRRGLACAKSPCHPHARRTGVVDIYLRRARPVWQGLHSCGHGTSHRCRTPISPPTLAAPTATVWTTAPTQYGARCQLIASQYSSEIRVPSTPAVTRSGRHLSGTYTLDSNIQTFSRNIARYQYAHAVSCHLPGHEGPTDVRQPKNTHCSLVGPSRSLRSSHSDPETLLRTLLQNVRFCSSTSNVGRPCTRLECTGGKPRIRPPGCRHPSDGARESY